MVELKELKYDNGTSKVLVNIKDQKCLQHMLHWHDYSATQNIHNQTDWNDFSLDVFEEFEQTSLPNLICPCTAKSTSTTANIDPNAATAADITAFGGSTPLDMASFIKWNGQYTTWFATIQAWHVVAKTCKLFSHVLADADYLPPANSLQEGLYHKHLAFMMSVLLHHIDKGTYAEFLICQHFE